MTENRPELKLFDEAKELFFSGKFQEAEELLRQFLSISPGHPTALQNLTAVILKQDTDVTSEQRDQIREIQRRYEQGYDAYCKQDFDLCLEEFEVVFELSEPLDIVQHYFYTASELIDEITLQIEVQENNRQIQILFEEGKDLYDRELYEECIEKMMSILSIDPGHEQAVVYITEATKRK